MTGASDPRMDLTLKNMTDYKGPKGNLGKWDTGRVAGKSSSSHIVDPAVLADRMLMRFGSLASSEMG